MSLDLSAIRSQFHSLDRLVIFLDNASGTQVAKQSLDRINRYLIERNANHGGGFAVRSHPMIEDIQSERIHSAFGSSGSG
jgi:selenocysteine lyase/cysteine desulfurase